MVSTQAVRPDLERQAETILLRIWPRWSQVVARRPAGTVPTIEIGIHEDSSGVRFVHTQQTPRDKVPDHPETRGFSRQELLSKVDEADRLGHVGVLILFNIQMRKMTEPAEIAMVVGMPKEM